MCLNLLDVLLVAKGINIKHNQKSNIIFFFYPSLKNCSYFFSLLESVHAEFIGFRHFKGVGSLILASHTEKK